MTNIEGSELVRLADDGRNRQARVEAQWFGVRCWFLFEASAVVAEAAQTYEERVTIWHADTLDEARSRAIAEADTYAGETGATRIDYVRETFRMFDPPGEGIEVWSSMRSSWLPPDEYVARFVTEGVSPGSDE